MFLPLGPGYCSTRYTRSQFRDDSVLICHPGRPSGARSIRDPEADRFYSWVPDTVRLATLAHSSGTTGGKISSSESGTTLFIGLGRQKSFVNAKSCDAIHCLDTPSMH